MLLNTVSDNQLLTSQIVKTILMIILAVGVVSNLFRLTRKMLLKKMIIHTVIFIFLTSILIFVYRQYYIDAALLQDSVYVSGTTLDYCDVFAEGQGIEFEYSLEGRTFVNCNTFHPVAKISIVVPGGKYQVRVAKSDPARGRMDFSKRMNKPD